MHPSIDMAAIKALPIDERVELAHAILDTIDEEVANAPLSDALKAELDRRVAFADGDPEAGTSWEVVRERVAAKVRARAAG